MTATPPNGPSIPMDQFTLGPRYDIVDVARDCGCAYCRQFIAQHEMQQSEFYTDQIVDVLKSADLSVTVRRWLPGEEFDPPCK